MRKTTVYLPDELKDGVTRVAASRGVSEAEVIRAALAEVVGHERPRPRGGLFRGAQPAARELDDHLGGFGER